MIINVTMGRRSHGRHVESVWGVDVNGDPDYFDLSSDERRRLSGLPIVTFFGGVRHKLTRRRVPCFYTPFTLYTYIEAGI
ncbi:hypothetical protein CMI47_22175 [Candidatus Pacearchaeota archaeon]|nr:hypothetical protein [Candidatus Pacearchaeota archaeon]|tara:strand:- start:22695 stop:22934 length:240 start_codon:yes stop_codon:yes gene_type:complete